MYCISHVGLKARPRLTDFTGLMHPIIWVSLYMLTIIKGLKPSRYHFSVAAFWLVADQNAYTFCCKVLPTCVLEFTKTDTVWIYDIIMYLV